MLQGAAKFCQRLLEQLATNDTPLTPMSRGLFQQLAEELAAIEIRVATYDT